MQVPPLRISLPRTPSEDGATVVNATDDTASAAANAGRRTTRGAKGHSKKNQSPDESANKICDESIQRITRSKLRQAGRQLRDQPAIRYEPTTKKKSNSWRRGSVATASPMPAPSLAASDEQPFCSNDAAERIDGLFGL
ncbi:unnamed protein product [Gongylonema pulchrum]|uniref:Uncharacterized protein n=1 Tax=Gongylonema pulchrum TaxID=637853 RepID=A0A183E139_9BILA|nr:unnamed protein product [Gongylonema pulchrum]